MNLVPYILSQILSSNYQIRTYVEALLVKFYRLLTTPLDVCATGLNSVEFLSDPTVRSTTKQIYSIIKPAIEDTERNASKMFKTFSFQFHPIDDYSVETIYYLLPSLFYVVDEELIHHGAFLCIVLDKQMYEIESFDYELDIGLPIRLKNKTSKLVDFSSNEWQFSS